MAGRKLSPDEKFNRDVGPRFADAYGQKTGLYLRFKKIGGVNPHFPDVTLEALDGKREIGVEFGGVIPSFVNQEHSYFAKHYQERFCKVLAPHRPRFKNVSITLQPSARRKAWANW